MSVWRIRWVDADGGEQFRYRGSKGDATSRARRSKREGAVYVSVDQVTVPVGYKFDFIDWLNGEMESLQAKRECSNG